VGVHLSLGLPWHHKVSTASLEECGFNLLVRKSKDLTTYD
jgi:hypothetical protein